jgi:adenine-specific DNA-methyltransferase
MTLVEFSHSAGRVFASTLERAELKLLGQFMTPPAIARFMAQRLTATLNQTQVRILEPAAGAGILAAAVVDELLLRPDLPERIDLVLYELDSRLIPTLESLSERINTACQNFGIEFHCQIQNCDFLLSSVALSAEPIDGLVVIANPPYFKLSKDDSRAVAHSYAVYGQPNIYGLFMAACARLVASGGRWCFITPRSWMNGAYFALVRRTIFQNLQPDSLHAFESRKDHFEEDAVLQEAVITWATGKVQVDHGKRVMVTRSQGISDLHQGAVQSLEIERFIGDDEHRMLALPTNAADPFEAWTDTLESLGLKVSTGPVVAFRAADYIRENSDVGTVPLLWMQHVTHNKISWPIRKKREHIEACNGSAWMLVPNSPMVVLRRFSPKEDQRRVTAAPYLGHLLGAAIGLENHLNYIYRPGGEMSVNEAKGISSFLNSGLVDVHFRARAGSTQVNAFELRKLPFPTRVQLELIGNAVRSSSSLAEIDNVVEQILDVKKSAAEKYINCTTGGKK